MNAVFYHVTEREDAAAIADEGFQGGWGDVGFGVYFYGSRVSAEDYAARGGWDGRLKDPVVIEVADPEIIKLIPHPSWDPDAYADAFWYPMDEDDDEAFWKPKSMRILDGAATPPGPGR